MISDAQKYDVAKRILQAWNQKIQDFREGMDDAAIAMESGVPEIEVRTIRWETVGDTRAERARLKLFEENKEKILEHLASGLIETASQQQEVWHEISSVTSGLRVNLEKLLNLHPVQRELVQAYGMLARRDLYRLLRQLNSNIKTTTIMLESINRISANFDWSLE
jgi:hypothetical protein